MRAYIIRRLLLVIPTLFLVTIIVFFSIRLVPGDVVDIMAEEQMHITGMAAEAIRHELGLDVPAHVQYGRWITAIITRGDFGKSLWTRRPVIKEILPRLPVTLELGLLALIVSQLMALPIGIYSAIRQDSGGDYIGRIVAISFMAIPTFWLGTMVMVFPSIWWGWTPSLEYIPFTTDPLGNLGMFIIPATVMGLIMSGTTMRMTRTMMLEALRQDYIRTAWAKGLKEKVVIMRHALKNALIPVVTVVGLQLPVLLGGAVITEQIFALPGMGRLLVFTIYQRDYTVLSGINLIVAIMVLIINISVDLTYAFLDPRVHYK